MLPFGLSADVLNFFLRWSNSNFHGGKSAYKCELGGTVELGDVAIASDIHWPSLFFLLPIFNFKLKPN